ncbi:ankyrin repeat-containing domain protein [Aspergillus unguis]
MHLLDLPLEVFHLILADLIDAIDPDDFTVLQLVNKTFALEARAVLCTSRTPWSGRTWQPLVNHLISTRALAPGGTRSYAFCTIRKATEWVAQHSERDCRQICQVLSRSAAFYSSNLLRDAVGWQSGRSQDSLKKEQCDEKEHRLPAAACLGDIELVRTLIDPDLDINTESDIFGTALVNAAREGHSAVVQFLLDKGADAAQNTITWTDPYRNESPFAKKFTVWDPMWPGTPFTALSAAAFAGHEEIVRIFLDLPADSKLSRSSCSFFHAISYAAWGGHVRILQTLISCADFDAIGPDVTKSVMQRALKSSAEKGHLDCMQFLLDAGVPVTVSVPGKETSALSYAATTGQTRAVELLLDNGADVNELATPLTPPIELALEGGFYQTVALLLDRGAEGRGGRFSVLTQCETPTMMRVLLERGVHERYPWPAKKALQLALEDNRQMLVDLLLEYGVTVDDIENTPYWP